MKVPYIVQVGPIGLITFLFSVVLVNTLAAASDTITLTNLSGAPIANYPVQIARPFVEGELPGFPQIGQCADFSCRLVMWLDSSHAQPDVKERWPDQSVKHAVISFVVGSLPTGTTYFRFRNSVSSDNTPIDQTAMLSPAFDFDATINASFGTSGVANISARAMLNAQSGSIPDCEAVNWSSVTNTTACYWLKGPVNTTVVLADHSPARSFDFGADSDKSLRPIFYASFWPTLSAVRVRFVVENANTEGLQEQDYSVTLTTGNTTSTTVYTNPVVTHYACTRWTKEGYWINIPAPSAAVNIDFNLAYLIATYAIPNYDTTKVPSSAGLTSEYSSWSSSSKDLYQLGTWSYKAMGTTGGRQAIGPYPSWAVMWLYSGDYRMREMSVGNADLASAWPFYFREGNATKGGYGRPITVAGRPTLLIYNAGQYLNYSYTTAADKIVPLTGLPLANGGWVNEANHLYQPQYIPYLLTGEFFYLEEMEFWTSWALFYTNPANTVSYGRGPTGAACIHAETRGDGWILVHRAEYAWIAPDAMIDKPYYSTTVTDPLACWEGERGITGTSLDGNSAKTWAAAFTGASTVFSGKGTPNLGFWTYNTGECQSPCNTVTATAAESPWMEGYLGYALNRVAEMGFPATPLRSWLAVQIAGMINNPSQISAYVVGAYRIPSADTNGNWFTTWTAAASGLDGTDLQAYFDGSSGSGLLTWEGYPYIIQSALAGMTTDPGGAAAWAWLSPLTEYQAVLKDNPTWAILPRFVSRPSCLHGEFSEVEVQDRTDKALAQLPCTTTATPCTVVDVQMAINSVIWHRCR